MPSSFVAMLKQEVGRMQIMHPEREGELARAHALITLGMVLPSADDPATGQVLSSDMQRTYSVNGTCSCQAGDHGKPCKHLHAWRLYRYIEKKLEGQATPVEPAPSAPLPEAPCSVNVRINIDGRDCQLTLRDTDEARLLQRLTTVLKAYPVQAPRSPQEAQGGWCAIHNVSMKLPRRTAEAGCHIAPLTAGAKGNEPTHGAAFPAPQGDIDDRTLTDPRRNTDLYPRTDGRTAGPDGRVDPEEPRQCRAIGRRLRGYRAMSPRAAHTVGALTTHRVPQPCLWGKSSLSIVNIFSYRNVFKSISASNMIR